TRENEFNLVHQAKLFTTEVERLNEVLAKADNYPDNFNTQADILREQLLTAENQLLCCEERCDELSYILESLRDEQKMLQRDYGRMPKEEETEKLRRQLERSCEEIRSETAKRCGEGRQLAQSLKDAQQTIQEEEKLVTITHVQLETLREEVSEASLLPLQYTKEADKLRKQKEEAEHLRDESTLEADQLKVEIETLEACRVQLDMESAKLG
ncbi:Coiled-coil domain-containing protein, partial [Paragonimus heterotremus]